MATETQEETELIDEIVSFAHNGNYKIIETLDFRDGVRYALRYKNQYRTIKFTNNESTVASTVIGNVIDALELDKQSGLYEDGGRILFRCNALELAALKRFYKKV